MMVYSKYYSKKSRRTSRSFSTRRTGILLLIITTVLLILLKVATWLNAQELFSLKNIKIEGNLFTKKSEILDLLKIDRSQNLLDFDTQNIATQVQQHPLILTASVSRSLPSSLIIKVEEKEPLAILNGAELSALDSQGHPMPISRPEIFFDYPVISSAKIDSELPRLIDFLNFLKVEYFSLYSEISEISFSQKAGIYFYLNENLTPVIWGNDSYPKKGESFLEVLALLKNKNEFSKVKYFDLRFKDQVIVKKM